MIDGKRKKIKKKLTSPFVFREGEDQKKTRDIVPLAARQQAMFLRAVGGTTVVLAGSVTLGAYTSPAIKARLEAADRAAALGGCVAIMALDYMRVDERIPSILSHQLSDGASATVLQRASKARKELAAAQLEQEKSGIELELALGRSGGAPRRMDSSGASVQVPHSVKDARMRCDAAKERMLRAATDLAEAEAACGADGITRLHKRNAKRLIAMARRNGGCYLKLAQHLAQLGHLLPPEYVTEAQTCLDDCPKSSTSDVRKVIEEELGASPEKLFDEFSHQPIASASLAQVHIARTKGEDNPGRKIAIKVQHRGLRETCVGDLEAVGLAVRLVAHAFPAFRLGWLVDEVAPHLPLELDFKHEAKNCRRAAKIFEKWEDVVVPEVLEATPRVLVMSFEEGICLNASNNRAGMNEAGIDSAATARLVGKSWLHQTFYHGFCRKLLFFPKVQTFSWPNSLAHSYLPFSFTQTAIRESILCYIVLKAFHKS